MKFPFAGKDRYINHLLATQLNSFVYNIKHDWDFIIIISGDRMVRVGKSTMGQIIAGYISYRLVDCLKLGKEHFNIDHIYFDSRKMTRDAMKRPRYSISIYDEGREGLSTARQYDEWQKDLLDYFAECGQLNHVFIIILDDFFGLPEQVSVGRSECLVNVYRDEKPIMTDLFGEGKIPIIRYDRGQIQFFNRREKQLLYDIAKAKRMKSYTLVKTTVPPLDFTRQWLVDEEEYKKKKLEYLKKRADKHEGSKARATDIFRDKIIWQLDQQGATTNEIYEHLKKHYEYEVTTRHIRRILHRIKEIYASSPVFGLDKGQFDIQSGETKGESEGTMSGVK